jgi:Spy/CpxP family protein refolding chaperone
MGFLFGTACLVGLLVMVAKHRHHRWGGRCGRGGFGGGGHGPWDEPWSGGPGSRWGGGGFFRQQLLRHLSVRLGATPGQEKVIASAADEALEAGRAAHEAMRATKKDVAEVFAGPAFDESLLGDVFSRQDDAIRSLRLAVSGALGKVHEVLEPEQRARLAELLARGPGRWSF